MAIMAARQKTWDVARAGLTVQTTKKFEETLAVAQEAQVQALPWATRRAEEEKKWVGNLEETNNVEPDHEAAEQNGGTQERLNEADRTVKDGGHWVR